jgi:phosphoglycerate kinase
MVKQTIADLAPGAVRGRRVVVRVDYNVPLDDAGAITDESRIRATLPTLAALLEQGARVVLLAHFGRPKGKPDPAMSLRPAAERLAELLPGHAIRFVPHTVGAEAEAAVNALADGEAALLENTRFLAGEEKNDSELAEAMARLGDAYVNDAFGAAHRAHSSTAGIAEVMKRAGKPAVAGLLMARELEYLGGALERPTRPFVAIIGGSKISGKIDVIRTLLPKVDHLLIGGAMANTFFRAMGLGTGTSLVEEDRVDLARELIAEAGDKLLLPTDCVVTDRLEARAAAATVAREAIPADRMVADVGPATVEAYGRVIRAAKTVLWNGPMGVFEIPPSPRGRAAWRSPRPMPPTAAPPPWWAAATRPLRWRRWGSTRASRTSPPGRRIAGVPGGARPSRCGRPLAARAGQ